MKNVISTIWLLLISATSLAGDWSAVTKVGEINTGYAGGLILFTTAESHNNPKGDCDTAFYAVREGDANVEHILSVLLAAQRSSSNIQVGVDATRCDAGSRISVTRVRSLP